MSPYDNQCQGTNVKLLWCVNCLHISIPQTYKKWMHQYISMVKALLGTPLKDFTTLYVNIVNCNDSASMQMIVK